MNNFAQRLQFVAELIKREKLDPIKVEVRGDQSRIYLRGNVDMKAAPPNWVRFKVNRRKNHYLVVEDRNA